MRNLIRIIVVIALAPIALAACQDPSKPRPVLHSSFGDAVRHNMAVQIINPEGDQNFTPPGLDGDRAAIAVERYRTDKTEKVVEQRTSDVGGDQK